MEKRKSLSVIFFIILSGVIIGQDTILTINDAVDYAYNSNTMLQQMKAQLTQDRERWRTETGISTPEISYFREGISTIPESVFEEQRIAVSQEIDFPLTTVYRLKGIKQEARAMELRIQAEKRNIRAEVKKAYINVVYARYLQVLREEQLSIATELYNAVYTRLESGMATGVDLANAELQKEQAMNALDEAEWVLHEARYGLFNSMGLPSDDQKYTIAFSDTLRSSDVMISQVQSLDLQSEQPEYRAVELDRSAAEYFLKEAKSNSLPDININLYKQDYGQGYNYSGFEIGVSIPLWYPFEQKGKVNMAKAELNKLGWRQTEVELDIKKNIEYAWHNYSVTRRIMNRYNEAMREKASKLRTMALRSYQIGELDLLELLNAQQTYINSRMNYLTALRNYYRQLADLEKYLDTELVY
ncbi:MAG TPA: TolC family protein [Bacteroidales bacterium]|nr:TolC family protein [Bacteroidales bacterium]